jgi:purine-binding chemotaxis protein CheW
MFRDGPERLLVFRVGAERFAVRLSAVDEVVDAPQVRPLPDTAQRVMGLTTIRGALVTIYDPRPLLNVTGAVDDAALLFARGGSRVGLAVGGVYDTLLIDRDDVRPAPASDVSEKLLIGVVKRGRDLIGLLDADALLDSAVGVTEAIGGRK